MALGRGGVTYERGTPVVLRGVSVLWGTSCLSYPYGGTSLTRKSPPKDPPVDSYLGTYGGPWGGGLFLVSEVPLYLHVACKVSVGKVKCKNRLVAHTFCSAVYLTV